ncbi:unnamed protein product [Ectocarpus sp. CCAP 1310/34]|nr:unnamed protein product [Ectocarpus sp. CCAP 1310/34]
MEESYRAVGLAIFRLAANSGEEAECLKSQAVLRSVLQRHPVIRGFALSTLARRLREGAAAGNQPSQRHRASAGASAEARVPHTGIRLALEVLLASYHPSASHVVAPVVDALGDSSLEGGTSPLLPWAARLCLLHACSAGASAGSKRWRWLPTVADSACSLALQEIATEGSSSVSGSEAGKGKGRARGHGAKSAPSKQIANRVAVGTDKAEMYQATLMADVCAELARVEVAGPAAVSTKKSGFLFASLGTTPDDVATISSVRAATSLPERHAADSFRLKLQGLRDALLSRRGSEGNAPVGQSVPSVRTIIGDVALEDLDIHPQAVKRALERGRCGEAFILAVQAALKEQLSPTSTSEAKDQQVSSNKGRRVSVNLKHALETCLFGVGLAGGRGLLDAVVPDGDEIGLTSTSSSTRATRTTEARQACALMRGLVEEGTRIRDMLLVLVGMYQERERLPSTSSPTISMDSGRLTGAQVVATAQSACDFRRRTLATVVGAFVAWLADTPWVWGATEGVEGEDWEGDFEAAAMATFVVFPSPGAACADEGICTAGLVDRVRSDVRESCPYNQDSYGEGQPRNGSVESRGVDPTEVLDRLVAGAAMAMGRVDADEVEWLDVLRRVATAGAASDALKTYAIACVERSASLGGQAPFMVRGKRRFSQVGGEELWGLLQGACLLHEEKMPASLIVRTAAAVVTASRKTCQSWMVSPGLLGSSPIRVVIDMVTAAKGCLTASDLLAGLLEGPSDDGPALAADVFAAFIAASAAENGRPAGGDNEVGDLRSLSMAWLHGALVTAVLPVRTPADSTVDLDRFMSATALTRVLIQRVPFEAKPVLLAVEEAAELATAGRGVGGCPRRSGNNRSVSGRGVGENLDGDPASPLASLLKLAGAAKQSRLLPLPVPATVSPPRSAGLKCGEASGAGGVGVGDDGESPAKDRDGWQADASVAFVTAGLLLDAFVRSPTAARRSIREAMQQGGCGNELQVVQRVLRTALCTAPASPGQPLGGIPTTLPAGSGDRKVAACLLVGFLVESGVPGWDETKAAMTPPPPQLLVAAKEAARTEGETHVWHCDHSRQQLTALRLEVMLQSLLCDVGGSRLVGDMDIEKSFPDVFRTARTLARAIAHHASALVTRTNQGQEAWRTNDYHRFQSGGGGVEGVDPRWPSVVGGGCSRDGDGAGHRQLELPRRALAGRLQHSPAAAALTSWVSSIVKTVKQFRRWLPWQPLADELRELVLRNARQKPVRQLVSGGERNETEGRTLTAEAAVFAVSELLLAWDEGGEEVIPAVFRSVLCSKALNIAAAPVASDAPPPIWLELLRCLIDEGRCDVSGWMSSCLDGSTQQDPLAMAAAAAVWIGGDGPRAGQRSRRGTHEAWVHWYGARLGSLIPTGDAGFGDWLILSSATGASAGSGVQVRVEALARTIQPDEWQHWGRSPLQAAWNFPGTWAAICQSSESTSTEEAPPAILLPPFASWLRVVLRGGSTCPKHLLEAYLRRMALEVYLPCQFGRASNEMARQWLAVLIEAEATVEGSGRKRAKMAADAVVCDGGSVTADPSSGSAGGMVSACHLVVKAFFREELLRFGSGEAPAAPNGGPMSWLWPLEAVVAACGNNGSFGGGSLARRRRGSLGPERIDSDASSRITLDGPPSALARALSTVPHDLLCGSRRFGMGGQPPPALATLRAFATRVVDLTARALATPPCRHWSVARQLLLGLGLLYHALAKPVPTRGGKLQKSFGAPSRAGAIESDSAAQEAAQAVALSAIEGLVRIALGLGNLGVGERDSGEGGNRGAAAASESGNPLLTSACLALRPLETGDCAGADDFARALMGAGAWRAATAFFGERSAAQASFSVKAPSLGKTAPSIVQTASLAPSLPPPPRPLSPQAGPEQGHRLSSPGAMPAVEPHHSVGGDQASGQSTADCCISLAQELVGGAQPCSSGRGEREQVVGSPRALLWDTPSRQKKKVRLSTNAVEGKSPPASSPRRVLPMRSSKQQHHHEGSES